MRSERVTHDVCGLARRWVLEPALVRMLVALEAWASETLSSGRLRWPGLRIISGRRNEPVVPALNPSQPPATESRHLTCPSLAVDLRVGLSPASVTPPEVWTALGRKWTELGGRWGGDFDPPDWNHFDIDPSLADRRA